MPEVTNELMYELLKGMHARFDKIDTSFSKLRSELNSLRGTMVSVQSDIHNVYGTLYRQDEPLDRIERRLEINELAEAGVTFEHD